jgi:hypothetical protein
MSCDRARVRPRAGARENRPTCRPEPVAQRGPYDEGGQGERYWSLPETSVRLVARVSAPETHPLLRPDPSDTATSTAVAYERWLQRLRRDGEELVETIPPQPPLHSLLESEVRDQFLEGAWPFLQGHQDQQPLWMTQRHKDALNVLRNARVDDRLPVRSRVWGVSRAGCRSLLASRVRTRR